MKPWNDQADAAIDLVGRTGARQLEIGFLHEDVPADQADWYAHAQYRGARIITEHHTGPAQALEALAVKLLTGAQCQHCKGLVALSRAGAAFTGDHADDGIDDNGHTGPPYVRRDDTPDAMALDVVKLWRTSRKES